MKTKQPRRLGECPSANAFTGHLAKNAVSVMNPRFDRDGKWSQRTHAAKPGRRVVWRHV